jgi:hypothetical protein
VFPITGSLVKSRIDAIEVCKPLVFVWAVREDELFFGPRTTNVQEAHVLLMCAKAPLLPFRAR